MRYRRRAYRYARRGAGRTHLFGDVFFGLVGGFGYGLLRDIFRMRR